MKIYDETLRRRAGVLVRHRIFLDRRLCHSYRQRERRADRPLVHAGALREQIVVRARSADRARFQRSTTQYPSTFGNQREIAGT